MSDTITRTVILCKLLSDITADIDKGFKSRARKKMSLLIEELSKNQYKDVAIGLPPEAEKASEEYALKCLEIVAPDMAHSNYSKHIKESQIHFCARDLAAAFETGYEHREKALWHPGTENPEVEDGSGELFVVIPSVQCDMDAFFCFYNNGEPEPWHAVVMTSADYHLSLAHNEVERWARFDELMNIKRD